MFNKLITAFILGSFFGWICEVVGVYIVSQELVNRGFLYGPFLPIYGLGGVLFILIFYKKKHNVISIFIVGMIVASVIEYFTSVLLEEMFDKKWWDYSSYDFNLHGRISLWSSTLFGLGSVFVMKLLYPFVNFLYKKNRNNYLKIINKLFLLYFVVDLALSIVRHTT